MNSPAYVFSKVTQRLQYNLGRVQKEAGLRKYPPSLLNFTISLTFTLSTELDRIGS